jgi:NADPH-dependent 2,4-dienoyl-CoA reductase/sulfur reductase-like enzyme
MAATLAASREGARVLVIERNRFLGGILNQCIHDGFGLSRFGKPLSGPEYAGIFVEEIAADKNISVLLGVMVTGTSSTRQLYCVSREGRICCEAGALVFATGCRERTRGAIAIPGSRPAGIYTAGVVQQLINLNNITVGKRAVILGSGDIGLIMARRLALSGIEVVCVLEKLPYCGGLPRNVYQCLEDYNIPLYLGRTVTEIRGSKRLESVAVSCLDARGILMPGSEYEIPCDTLILSVGLIPENEIVSQTGAALLPDTNGVLVDNRMETSISGVFACGNAVYVNDLADNVSTEGELAGKWAAARALGRIVSEPIRVPVRNGAGVRSVTPQKICSGDDAAISLRVNVPGKDQKLRILSGGAEGGRVIAEKLLIRTSPAVMLRIKLPAQDADCREIRAEVV